MSMNGQWGFNCLIRNSIQVSWVPETFPGYGNACLLDDNLVRKPAYYALSDMLREVAAAAVRAVV